MLGRLYTFRISHFVSVFCEKHHEIRNTQYTLFTFHANFVFYQCHEKINHEIFRIFAWMPILARNAKSEKRGAKYPAMLFLFFAFHAHFCVFRDKCIAGVTVYLVIIFKWRKIPNSTIQWSSVLNPVKVWNAESYLWWVYSASC